MFSGIEVPVLSSGHSGTQPAWLSQVCPVIFGWLTRRYFVGLKGMFGRIAAKHEEIKKKIHSFRIPLPHWGQRLMGTLTVASTTDSLTYWLHFIYTYSSSFYFAFNCIYHHITSLLLLGFIYFCIPIIAGCYVMDWAQGQSEKNIGVNGEKLKDKYAPQEMKKIRDEIGSKERVRTWVSEGVYCQSLGLFNILDNAFSEASSFSLLLSIRYTLVPL